MYSDDEYQENSESQEVNSNVSSGGFYQNNKILIWIFIAVVIIVLGIVIFKNMNNNSNNNSNTYYTVNVTPESAVFINPGKSYKLDASVPNVPSAQVTWTSSDENVATVDSTGTVTAVGYGKTIITATYIHTDGKRYDTKKEVSIVDGTSGVSVTGVLIKDGSLMMPLNGTYSIVPEITPADAYVFNKVFTSSDESIVTVDNNGFVQAVGEGEALITLNINEGDFVRSLKVFVSQDYTISQIVLNPTKITLSKEANKIKVGSSVKLSYTIEPVEASGTVLNWTSDNESVLTVDKEGIITAIKEGTATVKVLSVNGKSDTLTIEVEPDVVLATDMQVALSDLYLEVDQRQVVVPTMVPDNTTDKTITCSSSNPTIVSAEADSTGAMCQVTAIKEGTAALTIKSNSNTSVIKTINVTVSKASSGGSSGSSSGCSKYGSECSSNNTSACAYGKYCSCGYCKSCPKNYYCRDGKATKCPSGTTSNGGSSSCTATSCPAGQGSGDPLISLCSTCGKGYYSPAGDTKCHACPTGYTTSKTGATSSADCNVCKAGYYKSGSSCLICQAPYYCSGGSKHSCSDRYCKTTKSGATSESDCVCG